MRRSTLRSARRPTITRPSTSWATGSIPTAWAADGTIEAFELDGDGPFLVAVQWHPEAGDDPSLFRALVTAARARTPAPA